MNMPSSSAESEAFDVVEEKTFGISDKGDKLTQWDLLKKLDERIAADYITAALVRTGVKVTWDEVYRALTRPL